MPFSCNCGCGVNQNYVNRRRNILIVNGPPGPPGPPGVNTSSINNAYFSTYGPVTVSTLGDIPLTSNNVLNGNAITHTTGSAIVNLLSGTYSINFSACPTVPAGQTLVSYALYVNGIILPETSVLSNSVAGDIECMAGSSIITLNGSGNIKLVNLTNADTDFRRVMLVILKIR